MKDLCTVHYLLVTNYHLTLLFRLKIIRLVLMVSTSVIGINVVRAYVTGGGIDYKFGLYNVTFPARMTKVSFSIAINNDNILEDDEEFILIIITDSLPNGVVAGDTNKATVIIRNDDSKLHSILSITLITTHMYVVLYAG